MKKKNSSHLLLSLLGAAVLVLAFGEGAASQGAMYKYTDNKGVTHFTDRYESIPREYRNQIQIHRETARPGPGDKPVEIQEKKGEAKAQPAEGAPPDPAKKEAEEKEKREKADQEKKQQEFDQKAKRIEDLKKEIAEREKELQGLRTTWMVFDRQTVFRLNQEIAGLRKEIEEIRKEIDELK